MKIASTRTCPPLASLDPSLPGLPDYRWVHVVWTVSLPDEAA